MVSWLLWILLAQIAVSRIPNLESRLVVAQVNPSKSEIKLSQDDQNYCYDYQLSQKHQFEPQVGISISSFNFEMRLESYISVRVRTAEISQNVIPLILRILKSGSSWKSVGFNVIASSREDLEISIFRLETTSLTGCNKAQSQSFTLEVQTNFPVKNSNAVRVFLSGWDIDAKFNINGGPSPLEATLSQVFIQNQQLSITINRISKTEISSIIFTYIIVKSKKLNFETGLSLILPTSPTSANLITSTSNYIFHFSGLSGFIFQSDGQSIDFNVQITPPQTLTFSSKTMNQLMMANVQYLFLKQTNTENNTLSFGEVVAPVPINPRPIQPVQPVQPAPPIQPVQPIQPFKRLQQIIQPTPIAPSQSNLNQPPSPAQPSQNTRPPAPNLSNRTCPKGCRTCPNPRTCSLCIDGWVIQPLLGSICIPLNGNLIRGKLNCNYGYKEVNGACALNCSEGQYIKDGKCEKIPVSFQPPKRPSSTCPPDSYLQNGSCFKIPEGGIWNVQGQYLVCKEGYYFKDNTCFKVKEGQYLFKGTPACRPGFVNISGTCTRLGPNEIFINGNIICNNISYPMNDKCETLPRNTFWDGSFLNCVTGSFQVSYGNCVIIPPNAIWNGAAIVCREGFYNTSGVCSSLPLNAFWNGTGFACKDNFYNISGSCTTIPDGTEWNGTAISCKKGFTNFSGKCIYVPAFGYWNGSEILCFGGHYKVDKECIALPPNSQFKNNILRCQAGYYNMSGNCTLLPANSEWNGVSLICKQGFYFNQNKSCIVQPQNTDIVNGMLSCKAGFQNISGNCTQTTGRINIVWTGKATFEGRVILNLRVDGIPINTSEELLNSENFLSIKIVPDTVSLLYYGYVENSKSRFNVLVSSNQTTCPPFQMTVGLSDFAKNSPFLALINTNETKKFMVDTTAMMAQKQAVQSAK